MIDRTERGYLSWVAALGLVLLVGGSIAWLQQPTSAPARDAAVEAPEPTRHAAPPPEATRGTVIKKWARPPWRPGTPERIVIDRLGVDAPVVPIGTTDDTLIPPGDPMTLGWWRDGARTGDELGSALVTGHTVHTGGGALDDLEQLTPGDVVTVQTSAGRIRYDVRSVRVYSKGTIAQDAEELFSQESEGRLVLITCEDWDGVKYLSNVVVVALPFAV